MSDETQPGTRTEEPDRTETSRAGWRALAPWFLLVFGVGLLTGWGIGRSGVGPGTGPRVGDIPPNPLLKFGQSATSSRGNKITVHSFDTDVNWPIDPPEGREFAEADVEWCAGEGESIGVRYLGERFTLEMPDASRVVARIDSHGPGELAGLPRTIVASGECVRGLVVFDIPADQEPEFVVFSGAQTFKWKVDGGVRSATPTPSGA